MILVETQQQIDALDIKTGGEKANVARRTMGDEFPVHVLREFQAAKHLILGFFVAHGLGLVVCFLGAARNLAVGVEGLEFDKISTSLSGRINELLGQPDVAIMVNASFGDDENSVLHDFLLPKKRA